MNFLSKLAVNMNADDFVCLTQKLCKKDKEVAWSLFKEGLNGDVTKTFLRKCNLTKDIFTPDGKQIWKSEIYKELEDSKLDEKTTTIRDLFSAVIKYGK